jgi:starch phosphorylase
MNQTGGFDLPDVPSDPGRRNEGAAITVEMLRRSIIAELTYSVARSPETASKRDWCLATSLAVRDYVVDRWINAREANYDASGKRVYYFSLEFLIGRLLMEVLSNIGLVDVAREALASLGVDLEDLRTAEPTPLSVAAAWGALPPASWRAWQR